MHTLRTSSVLLALSLLAAACTTPNWDPTDDSSAGFQPPTAEAAPQTTQAPPMDDATLGPDETADSAQPSTEDCSNGIDDDWDELADCVDPECSDASSCIPTQSSRFTVRLETSFWAIYVADTDEVYEDSSLLEGQVQVVGEFWEGSEWHVDCTTRLPLAGERTDHPDFALWFELTVGESPLLDGCQLQGEFPEFPIGLGFHEGNSVGEVLQHGADAPTTWSLLDGEVDWQLFASQTDYSVSTPGTPLYLQAP